MLGRKLELPRLEPRLTTRGFEQCPNRIGKHALASIQRYMMLVRAEPRFASLWASGGAGKSLFMNKHGGRLSSRSVRRKLDKYLKEAGLDPTISPHTLRHSFATHMLRGGAPLRSVQELLGHANISTTQVYTQIANEHVRQVYEKAHPRAR